MTRCLVTGAGGFVGHHVLQHLLMSTDWDIIATDSFRHKGKTDRVSLLLDWRPEWRARTEVITHDLSVPFSDQAAYRIAGKSGLDYLIAIASESHVDRSIADPVPFVRNNIDVTLCTLELARALKPKSVLQVSTDEVYGPVLPGQEPHQEWDATVPSNPYSASKAAQEAIAISYWRTYGVPAIITNTSNMYGERQEPEKFLPMLIRIISEERTAMIHGKPGNIGSRHYLHARNMASAWLFLLENTTPGMFPDAPHPDRYSVTGSEAVSNLEFAQAVADIIGKPLHYELVDFHNARQGHDPRYGLNADKIARMGWKPPLDFRESLERTVRWTLENPEWMI